MQGAPLWKCKSWAASCLNLTAFQHMRKGSALLGQHIKSEQVPVANFKAHAAGFGNSCSGLSNLAFLYNPCTRTVDALHNTTKGQEIKGLAVQWNQGRLAFIAYNNHLWEWNSRRGGQARSHARVYCGWKQIFTQHLEFSCKKDKEQTWRFSIRLGKVRETTEEKDMKMVPRCMKGANHSHFVANWKWCLPANGCKVASLFSKAERGKRNLKSHFYSHSWNAHLVGMRWL